MATSKSTATPTTEGHPQGGTGVEVETEHPVNKFGEVPDPHLDRFPEGTNARADKQTLPSGQGGATPHDGISYQDQFPPNPEPSDTAKAWGEYLDAKERGEDVEPPMPTAESESTHTDSKKSTSAKGSMDDMNKAKTKEQQLAEEASKS